MWNPIEPVTVTLSVECESHDAEFVKEILSEFAASFKSRHLGNVGPVKVSGVSE